MGDMADFTNEIHELECEEYEDLRYASLEERCEAGHIDEQGVEIYQNPVLLNPNLTQKTFGTYGEYNPYWEPDPNYYHRKFNDVRLIRTSKKSNSYFVEINDLQFWLPKKICRDVKWGPNNVGSMLIYTPILAKIVKKVVDKTRVIQ